MGPTVAVIFIGVLYAISFAAFIISFARLRSDMHAGFDRLEARLDSRFDRLDSRFDRLEARPHDLIVAPENAGRSTEPRASSADD